MKKPERKLDPKVAKSILQCAMKHRNAAIQTALPFDVNATDSVQVYDPTSAVKELREWVEASRNHPTVTELRDAFVSLVGEWDRLARTGLSDMGWATALHEATEKFRLAHRLQLVDGRIELMELDELATIDFHRSRGLTWIETFRQMRSDSTTARKTSNALRQFHYASKKKP